MTQFELAVQPEPATHDAPEPTTSRLAIAALVAGILAIPCFCCPLFSVTAIILAIVALVLIGGNAYLKGRGFATAGLVLGVMALVGLILLAWIGWTRVFAPLRALPETAMHAAAVSNVDEFRECFAPPGGTSDDAEVEQFFAQLHASLGKPTEIVVIGGSQDPAVVQPGAFPLALRVTFDGGSAATATATCQIVNETTGALQVRLRAIEIETPDNQTLRFPPAAEPKQ